MTQHLALITKTQSLIAAGDIVGAESALAELADSDGDGALVVVLDALPAKDVLAGQNAFVESGIKLPADDGPGVSPAEPGPSSKPDVRRVVPRPSVEY